MLSKAFGNLNWNPMNFFVKFTLRIKVVAHDLLICLRMKLTTKARVDINIRNSLSVIQLQRVGKIPINSIHGLLSTAERRLD